MKQICKRAKWNNLIHEHNKEFIKDCQRVKAYGNINYLSPEYINAYRCTKAIDMYYMVAKERHEAKFGMPVDGICDSPKYLAKQFPKYNGIVYLGVIRRKDQPRKEGFRAHKWGTMYSKFSNQPEYLADANGKHGNPLIDKLYLFYRAKAENHFISCCHFEKYQFSNGIATKIDDEFH